MHLKQGKGKCSRMELTWSPEGCAQDGTLLAGADASRFFSVGIPSLGSPEPKVAGGFDAFLQENPHLESQAYNEIKKCASCGKPCATTMEICNACGASLKDVAITKSPNLFIGFIYGVDKANFPLKISMRHETEDIMVFDDPLAITRAHVLAVPTNVPSCSACTIFFSDVTCICQ